jgi:sterol desaturase/sphingolipid hydroxylase (fatty acid hydroxylase superfamily)
MERQGGEVQIMEAIIPVLIPVFFVVGLVLERVFPARKLPQVKGWWLRGVVAFFVAAAMNALLPMLVVSALDGRSLLHLSWLGTLGGALLTFIAGDFVSYWVHRAMHNVQFIWRWTHQMHHSAERLDVLGFSYFHPFDFAVTIALGTAFPWPASSVSCTRSSST